MAELVTKLANRPRITDRDLALEPEFLERILAQLDQSGPSEIGDVIHSLIWRANLLEVRSVRFSKEIARLTDI